MKRTFLQQIRQNRILTWIWLQLPIRRKTLRCRLDQELQRHLRIETALKTRYQNRLDDAKKDVRALVKRLSHVEFDRDGKSYIVSVRFDPEVVSGYATRGELDMIAKIISHEIGKEIASSKFIQSANALERERLERTSRRRNPHV